MEEVPFAGHPTLGTAFVIGTEMLEQTPQEIVLHLGIGSIPVRFEGDTLWMHQKRPEFGETVDAETMGRVMNSPAMAAGFEDAKRFLDLDRTYALVVDELVRFE